MKEPLVVDIETTGLTREDKLMCIGWQWADQESAQTGSFDVDTLWAGPAMTVVDALASPDVPIVEAGLFDAQWLTEHGDVVNGDIYNIQVMAWLINENTPLNLEWLAIRYLHHQMDKRIRSSAGHPVFKQDDEREVPLAEAPLDQVMAYNVRDVETTTKLFLYLRQRMQESAWWDYYLTEHLPFTRVLLNMQLRGLPVDLEASAVLEKELDEASEMLHQSLLDQAKLPPSFNVNSGPQMANFLFRQVFELTDQLEYDEWTMAAIKACWSGDHEDCGAWDMGQWSHPELHTVDLLPKGFSIDKVGRTKVHGRWTLVGRGIKGGMVTPAGDRYSTSSPALLTNFETAKDPWVTTFLRYRKMTKVLTTYLRKFPILAVDGRVHGSFNQTGTVTGRLSSSSPNLQNIPAHGELGPRVRSLFRAAPGTRLLVGDYSQLEPRLMAHFSQDPFLLDVYTTGKDIYRYVAAHLFGVEPDAVTDDQRGIGKTYVLAMGYGAGAKKLQQILTINGYPMPIHEVEKYLHVLQDDIVPDFFRYREAVIREAKRKGYVQTIGGQHRRLAAQFKSNTWKARGYGERQAVNAVIQGSAGDVVRRVMMRFDQEMPHYGLLAQVHDELVWEYDLGLGEPDLDEVKHLAETGHGFDISVPLVFEPHTGATWLEAKEGSSFLLPEDFASPFEDDDQEVEEDAEVV
jgi:DNA polymerase I-like protein with 3'-5' exonuclease and polymerase domains